MMKKYKRQMLILSVLLAITVIFSKRSVNMMDLRTEEDVNINYEFDTGDFDLIVGEPIFYPEEDIIYFETYQELINPLFIGGANELIISNDRTGEELGSVKLEEGENYTPLEMSQENLDNIEAVTIQILNNEEVIFAAKKYISNVIYYEDLSDYNEEGKSKDEMYNEINYFVYSFVNDPLLEVEDLEKYNAAEEFSGSVKKQHEKLVEYLDSIEYSGDYQDEVIEYYKAEIPDEEYKTYVNSNSISEKQQMYAELIDEVQYNLQAQIIELETKLLDGKYVNEEEISELESGLNLLKQRDLLQSKLDEYSNVDVGIHSD
ncbi:hypothetical protein R2F61_07335 [Mollicutes bacterium LVI A0078]|nr:hypothetical protein R2F61_07335 [Mollicutes bacterium LVI A0078]